MFYKLLVIFLLKFACFLFMEDIRLLLYGNKGRSHQNLMKKPKFIPKRG